jgi:hypothetical protein
MIFEGWWRAAACVALGGVLGAGAARAAGGETPVVVELVVRSIGTAKPLPAAVRIVAADPAAGSPRRIGLPASGSATIALERGAWKVTAAAPGHRWITARLVAAPDAPATWVFELEPAAAPDAGTTPLDVDAAVGQSVLAGLVVATESGLPLAGARVRTDDGATTWTDEAGSYELRRPAEGPPGPDLAGWPTVSIEVSYGGRITRRLEGILPVPGRLSHLWRLSPGAGTEVARDEHRLHGANGGAALAEADPEAAARDRPRPPSGVVLTPPESVRVGFADAGCSTPCCTAACTAVCVLPLESYVARGLNDEWISSWDADSLAAGAIAYRSYAAWRVDHPIRPSFDLCSSACCQVNDPDTATRTDAAVAATAGILVERQGAAFAAEYSAENNSWDDPNDGLACSNSDLSCGDGAVGSPAVGWPCLADAVALGRGCFGHGRGMSQWGSKRWADPAPAPARTWRWIVDHYYNASGAPSGLRSAFLASPVDVGVGAICPRAAGPGARIALHATAEDLAALGHPAVLFGASVVSPTGVFFSDPDDDGPAPLAPGANLETRDFDLPAAAADGPWDVWLALWLDVDGDAAVTSADFRLDHVVLTDALEIDAALDLVFADCFEGGDAARWSAALP